MATNTISLVEKRNQRKGKIITILVHMCLLLLVLFPFLNYEPPEPQAEQFIVIDFQDEFKSAAKKSSTKKAAPTKGKEKPAVKKPVAKKKAEKKPKPKPVAKKKPVLTSNKAEKPIDTKPTKAKKKVEAPQKDPTPAVPDTPTEEVEEEVAEETVETNKEKPSDKTDGGAKTVGQSDGNGEGQSGGSDKGDSKTDGVADAGDKGMDFSGDGIFNRKVIYRADVKKITKEEGKIVVNLCINQSGRVVYAKLNDDLSTIETPAVLRKAIKLTTDYRFERDRSAPKKQCGKLTFLFEIEEEE